ncbi:MAG: TlpA disulfide reductase family protein [Verrucomicrobiota bacterium]
MNPAIAFYSLILLVSLFPAVAAADEETALEKAVSAIFPPPEEASEFEAAYAAAVDAGVPAQILLESKFAYHNQNNDDVELIALLDDFEKVLADFDPSLGKIARTKEEFEGLHSFLLALEARAGGDESVRQHLQDAFWKNPAQAALFAEVVSEIKKEEYFRNLVFDLDMELLDENGETITLRDAMGDQKALLLDFWASWCGICIEKMPELKRMETQLAAHGIVVGAINTEASPKIAKATRVEEKMGDMVWLVEPEHEPLTKPLAYESYPYFLLLDTEGRIRFHGDPDYVDMWAGLQKFDPTIQRPVTDSEEKEES